MSTEQAALSQVVSQPRFSMPPFFSLKGGAKKDARVPPALGYAPGFGSNIETNSRSVLQDNFERITVSQTSEKLLGGSSTVN
jgi:hypothetical protein